MTLTDKQRNLIVANMVRDLNDYRLKSMLSYTITAHNEHALDHPEDGLELIDAVTADEQRDLILLALKVAIRDLESRA